MKKRSYLIIFQRCPKSKKETVTRLFDDLELEDAKQKGANMYFFAVNELKKCACGKSATHKRATVKGITQPWECKQCYNKGMKLCQNMK